MSYQVVKYLINILKTCIKEFDDQNTIQKSTQPSFMHLYKKDITSIEIIY